MGFNTRRVDDIDPYLYGKVLVNAVINPITAVTGLRNGEIIEHEGVRDLVERVANECSDILTAKGLTLPYDDPLKKVLEVARNTAGNLSSMLQDVQNGRRTEVEYISGIFVKEAKKLGMEAPLNAFLLELLLSEEWARPSRP
jgi:2-dehydropantoate 2-reductase